MNPCCKSYVPVASTAVRVSLIKPGPCCQLRGQPLPVVGSASIAPKNLDLGCLVVDSYHERRLLGHAIELLHVLLVKLEVVEISVAGDPLWVVALRQRHPILLQAVPDQDLLRRLAMLLSY